MHPPQLLKPPVNRQTLRIEKLSRDYNTRRELVLLREIVRLSQRLDRAEYLLGPLARPRGALDFWAK